MNKKKIMLDMGLNIVASAIPIVILQLLILPLLAKHMSDDSYGLLVTILALLNVLPSLIGNVLNNIRLLYNNKYEEHNMLGDFNVLLLITAIINVFIVSIFTVKYDGNITAPNLFFTVIVSIIWLAREYYIVAFRIKINYVAIVINNIWLAVGYLVGYALFLKTGIWQMVYLVGYILCNAHIFITSNIWKEPLKTTSMFKKVTVEGSLLFVSNLFTRIITYADKILIYPILGGAVVSVLYAATVFGKVVSLVITPMTSVALSYLAKMNSKTDSAFKGSLFVGGVVCVIGYFACIIVSRPCLSILYPSFVDQAMNYIWITTATTVVQTMITIVNPFILKFFDMKWQIIINGINAITYVVVCLALLKVGGLMGFCVGALITSILKLLLMIYIYYKMPTGVKENTR